MKFRQLAERLKEYDFYVEMWGSEENAARARGRFIDYFTHQYTLKQVESPEFLDSDVPEDVLKVFGPLEEFLREKE
tara:strand:+ start:740 stop:967 length:228 start_codon:yes stop_codon:yes gene_type:complete